MCAEGSHLRSSGSTPWLEVAESCSMSAHELHELLDIAVERKEEIERYWNEHFSA